MKWWLRSSMGWALFGLNIVLLAGAGERTMARDAIKMDSKADEQILAGFLKHTDSLPGRLSPEAARKIDDVENICWIWCPYLQMSLAACRLTGDPKYLDIFIQSTEALKTRLSKGPEGFLGFRGLPYGDFRDKDHPETQVEVNIAEFQVTSLLCEFVEIVKAEPALEAKYGPKAKEYLALAEHDLAGKKWEMRKEYVDLGREGAIFRMAGGLGEQRRFLTDPHNKQSKMCRAYLALYRVTGNDEYFKKAVKLGTRTKHTIQLEDNHYRWDYWDPAGDWDRVKDKPGQWRHWIGPEHRGGYHELTVAMAEALYDHGVVFDAADMQRFVNTQTRVCWNGSMDKPVFLTTGGKPSSESAPQVFMAETLARFNPAIREFCYGPRAAQERLAAVRDDWSGGAMAVGYLCGKYLVPRAAEPTRRQYREQFCRNPENVQFLKEMDFTIPMDGGKTGNSKENKDNQK